jgi:uncharacterized membrane protein
MAVNRSQQTQVDMPLETCFEYVDDWRNVTDWLLAVEQFEPVGEREQGLGSVFDVVLHAGIKVKTRLEVTDYVQHRLIEFESVQGFKVRNRWHFEPLDEGSTLITTETELHPPFGPAGKAMGKVMEPAVRKIMERSSSRLKGRLEAW